MNVATLQPSSTKQRNNKKKTSCECVWWWFGWESAWSARAYLYSIYLQTNRSLVLANDVIGNATLCIHFIYVWCVGVEILLLLLRVWDICLALQSSNGDAVTKFKLEKVNSKPSALKIYCLQINTKTFDNAWARSVFAHWFRLFLATFELTFLWAVRSVHFSN